MTTTAKGVPVPDLGDPPNGPAQISAVADWIDAHPGISPLTYAAINALAGGDLWEGRCVYQTDTGSNRPVEGPYWFNGIDWRLPWNEPWGLIGSASISADTGAIPGLNDVPGLEVDAVFVANRKLEIEISMPWCVMGSNGAPLAYINDDVADHLVWMAPNGRQDGSVASVGAGNMFSVSGRIVLPSVVGAQAYKARINGNGGTVTVRAFTAHPSEITVTDIGPNGAPA